MTPWCCQGLPWISTIGGNSFVRASFLQQLHKEQDMAMRQPRFDGVPHNLVSESQRAPNFCSNFEISLGAKLALKPCSSYSSAVHSASPQVRLPLHNYAGQPINSAKKANKGLDKVEHSRCGTHSKSRYSMWTHSSQPRLVHSLLGSIYLCKRTLRSLSDNSTVAIRDAPQLALCPTSVVPFCRELLAWHSCYSSLHRAELQTSPGIFAFASYSCLVSLLIH
eukprot:4916648-Amphidinium_carterae.1